MSSSSIGSRRIALTAIFAAIYAVLNIIPVSRLVGSVSFLSVANVFSPLVGMVLGPWIGGFSVLVGTFVSFALGKPVGFDGLDFIPGVIAAVTAGLAIRGKTLTPLLLSIIMLAIYSLDPLSAPIISVGGIPVPFLWMHILAAILFAALSAATQRWSGGFGQVLLIGAIVFLSTMNAHVAGSIMGENVLFRINGVFPQHGYIGYWTTVFYSYPPERVFFAVAGTLLAVPVLRALTPETLKALRRD